MPRFFVGPPPTDFSIALATTSSGAPDTTQALSGSDAIEQPDTGIPHIRRRYQQDT